MIDQAKRAKDRGSGRIARLSDTTPSLDARKILLNQLPHYEIVPTSKGTRGAYHNGLVILLRKSSSM